MPKIKAVWRYNRPPPTCVQDIYLTVLLGHMNRRQKRLKKETPYLYSGNLPSPLAYQPQRENRKKKKKKKRGGQKHNYSRPTCRTGEGLRISPLNVRATYIYRVFPASTPSTKGVAGQHDNEKAGQHEQERENAARAPPSHGRSVRVQHPPAALVSENRPAECRLSKSSNSIY